MERLAASQLDLDSVGSLVANLLQSWRRAGLALHTPPQTPETAYADLKNPSPTSAENGVCLPAPIHDGPSLSSPGEHPKAVCLEGQSAGTGLDARPDPGAGCRLGAVSY